MILFSVLLSVLYTREWEHNCNFYGKYRFQSMHLFHFTSCK